MGNGLNKRTTIADLLCMLPIVVFVLSILLVRVHMFTMPMTNVYWSEATDTSVLADIFNYWKSVAIIAAAALSVIAFVVAYLKDLLHFKKSFIYIPALIYVSFVFISLFFSKYKYFALRGMSEHFEGSIVLLAYMMMLFFLVNIIDSERRLKYIFCCVFVAAFLLGILGITQATGHDFFTTVIGQKLMTPNYMLDSGVKSWDMIDILAASGKQAYEFTFESGKVYQTVYNINYVPLYLVLLIPITAALFVFYGTNKQKRLLAFVVIILFGLLDYNFFAASSSSGYIGLLVVAIAAISIFYKQIKKWYKVLLCLILVIIITLCLALPYWLPEVKNIMATTMDSVISRVYAESTQTIQNEFVNRAGGTPAEIDYIETYNDYMVFSINGSALRITRDNANASFSIVDNDFNQLYVQQVNGTEGVFEVLDNRFHDFITISLIKKENLPGIKITTVNEYGHTDWPFLYNNGFYYVNRVNKLVQLHKVSHVNIFSFSSASGRGRIWNTTIPLLKNSIIWATGADTYCFAFPQNDYAVLYNTRSGLATVTDKAHNLYMQYWVNTGLISLLAWLTMVGYYLVGAVKQFRKRGFIDFCDFVNGGIFCGILGFLAVAFFNDGSVNTMPMFYTMLGTGLAINMRDQWPSVQVANE